MIACLKGGPRDGFELEVQGDPPEELHFVGPGGSHYLRGGHGYLLWPLDVHVYEWAAPLRYRYRGLFDHSREVERARLRGVPSGDGDEGVSS